MCEAVLFYSFAVLAITTALLVVLIKHPIYSVLFLVLTMFSLAAIYITLHAFFVAAIQVIVYAGAILVLFLFVVMLLNLDYEGDEAFRSGPARWLAFPLVIGFLTELSLITSSFLSQKKPELTSLQFGSSQQVGKLLFTNHLMAFEVVSLILLAAIMGATVISKRNWK